MENERDEREFSAEGSVIEVLERAGRRFAKILIEPDAVLEVPVGSVDVSLGDRVTLDASLNVTHVSGRSASPTGPRPAATPRALASGPGGSPGTPTLRDYQHVLRMAGLFVLGILVFLIWRSWMVPDDFGIDGHYRAGAIDDAAARPVQYAGQAACIVCHDEVQQVRATKSHALVACEACHGPLGQHARGETDVAPIRPSTRGVCLTCHTSRLGMPRTFPQVIVNEHAEAGPCTDCHESHAPDLS